MKCILVVLKETDKNVTFEVDTARSNRTFRKQVQIHNYVLITARFSSCTQTNTIHSRALHRICEVFFFYCSHCQFYIPRLFLQLQMKSVSCN